MSVTSRVQRDEPGWLLEYEETYDTDPADLWEAITTPERLSRWMATKRGDFRLGGHWQAFGIDGDVYCDGVVEACDPPRRFTTTWVVVGEPPTRLTVALEPDGDRTILRLRHEHVNDLEYGAGWHSYLEALARHLADPAAERDREVWLRRIEELEPAYAARFGASS